MRRWMAVVGVLWMAFGAGLVWGQARTGAIYGTVTDPDGNPLPGVTVELTSSVTARMTAVTDVDGSYRFPSLPPGADYVLRFTLQGFQPVVREGVSVLVGVNTRVDVTLRPGAVEEVVVRGAVPVVDVKSTKVAVNLSRDVLQELPTARDPWVMLELAPGIAVDRANVGGTESGQQSLFVARGDTFANTQWNIDGVNVTDPIARGGAANYWDFDAFEEMQVSVGANDIEAMTGGVIINFVTRRGGNRISGSSRFYAANDSLQGENHEAKADRLFSPGSKGNPMKYVYDYGLNLGGPIVKDRLWFWLGYGAQRINILTVTGLEDKTDLDTTTVKLNAQLGRHMTEVFFMANAKFKDGRYDIGPANQAPETTWVQNGFKGIPWFGDKNMPPIVKLQDEFFVGDNLFVSLRGAYVGLGFQLEPKGGRTVPAVYDIRRDYWSSTYRWVEIFRPTWQGHLTATYYKSEFLGGSHELKLGAEIRLAKQQTDQSYGNGMEIDWRDQQAGVPDSVWLYGQQSHRNWVRRISVFAQDTYRVGRLTLLAGIRFDNQVNGTESATSPPNETMGDFSRSLFPGITSAKLDGTTWNTFSPRIGLTYDLFGTAKTLLKANFAVYPEVLATQGATLVAQTRLLWIQYEWRDLNGDGTPQPSELGRILQRNFDPANPTLNRNAIDPDNTSPKRMEFTLGVEHQLLEDFGVGLMGFYRRNWDFFRTIPYDPDGRYTFQDFLNCWTQAGTTVSGWPYYYCTIVRPPWSMFATNKDYEQTYWGVELNFTKRMSRRWMLTGSLTLQDWKQDYTGREGYVDPTNIEQTDGRFAWEESSGSGRARIYNNTRWLAKLGVVVQLPLGFNAGATLVAREGFLFMPFDRVRRTSNGWGAIVNVWSQRIGEERLPTYWMLNARIEKMFNFGSAGRLYLTVDGFNITNNAVELGWFQVKSSLGTPNPDFKKITELMAPRVFRLGIRYEL
jgi:hypothetical protein